MKSTWNLLKKTNNINITTKNFVIMLVCKNFCSIIKTQLKKNSFLNNQSIVKELIVIHTKRMVR